MNTPGDDYAQSSYDERRMANDRKYDQAWKDCPPDFLEEAAKAGVAGPEREGQESKAIEFNENYVSSAFIPDIAKAIDEYVDELIEKYGPRHEPFIRKLWEDMQKPMRDEIDRNKADTMQRIVGYLIYTPAEKGNLLARLHALLHSIPRFAKEAGYHSMRASAKECRVSPEWLRRQRDKWCLLLGLEPPSDGVKSQQAKEEYRKNANTNHWRRQKFHANGSEQSFE